MLVQSQSRKPRRKLFVGRSHSSWLRLVVHVLSKRCRAKDIGHATPVKSYLEPVEDRRYTESNSPFAPSFNLPHLLNKRAVQRRGVEHHDFRHAASAVQRTQSSGRIYKCRRIARRTSCTTTVARHYQYFAHGCNISAPTHQQHWLIFAINARDCSVNCRSRFGTEKMGNA